MRLTAMLIDVQRSRNRAARAPGSRSISPPPRCRRHRLRNLGGGIVIDFVGMEMKIA
jgi:hypothetical protein